MGLWKVLSYVWAPEKRDVQQSHTSSTVNIHKQSRGLGPDAGRAKIGNQEMGTAVPQSLRGIISDENSWKLSGPGEISKSLQINAVSPMVVRPSHAISPINILPLVWGNEKKTI